MPKKMIGVMIAIAVLAGVAGGGAGYVFAKKQAGPTAGPGMMNAQFGNGQGRSFVRGQNGQAGPGQGGDAARQFGRGLMGEVTSIDDKSLTVKLPDGSSKIVLLADSTQIEKTATAAKSDVAKGTQVRVIGMPNSDGSIAATMVMLNPPAMPGIPGQTGAPASSSSLAPGQK